MPHIFICLTYVNVVADKSSIQQRRRIVRKADGNVFTVNVGDNCIPGEYQHNNKEKITCQHCLAVANVYSNFQCKMCTV